MTLDRVLSLGIFFALALALSGCPGEDENPQSACDQIDCGTHSHCDVDLEECVCDAGFTFLYGACVDSRTVSCIDVAPQNATSVVEDIEIGWTSEGCGPVPNCDWACEADYDIFEGACINSREVECADESPENGSSRIETVQITYTDAAGWSAVSECDWDCDAGHVPWGDECVTTRMVPCEATEIPANASADVVDVEITYSEGTGWTAPTKCDWSCEVGYGEHQGACLASRTVACVTVAPANATSEFHFTTIYWDDYAQAWPAAPDCAWTCHAGLGEYEGECLASVEATCTDNPPANAETTDDSLMVTIVWSGSAWSSPSTCPWTCLADFDLIQGQCLNSRQVTCDGSSRPANSYAHFEDEVITYTDAGGWTLPSECDWSCDATYGEHPDFAGQCLQSAEVLCNPQGVVAPTNGSVDDTALVTVSWDDAAKAWSSDVCPWKCIAGYHDRDGVCVPNLTIGWCNVQWPDVMTQQAGVPLDFYGRVWVDGATGSGLDNPAITSKFCTSDAPITDPEDLDAQSCLTADFNNAVENNDEYMILQAFENPGEHEYVFAFSGDGGQTWTTCFVTEPTSSRLGLPGLASIFAFPVNGEFESWEDNGSGTLAPTDWSHGPHVSVIREETDVHRKDYAARLTRIGGTNSQAELTASQSPVAEGVDYQIDMWFLDNDPSARTNIIIEWLDATQTTIGTVSHGSAYTVDGPEWQLLRRTATAPAGAAFLRVATRIFGVPNASTLNGTVVLDSVVIRPVIEF